VDAPEPERSIIVSNGRCGSTLLSDLIAEEPDTLSVQEFFTAVPWAPAAQRMDGRAYWAILSSPLPEVVTLVRLGMPPKELRYPASGRWADRLEHLPRILPITLAKLTDDPDSLFDALGARVNGFEEQTLAEHHQMFLDVLTELTGRRRWVERSGGSSHFAQYLLRAVPTARVVNLTRNWQETAVSMSRHPSYQLVELRIEALSRFGLDPFEIEAGQEVPEEMEQFLPERLTADLLRERGADLSRYLGMCAFMSSQAEQALADSPPPHLLTMRYEDLVADPVGELSRLGRFLQFADPDGWARKVAGRVVRPARDAAAVAA
jgi:putative sulfotransferase